MLNNRLRRSSAKIATIPGAFVMASTLGNVPTRAQTHEGAMLTENEARGIVMPLYGALTARSPEMVSELLRGATTPDWQNCAGNDACDALEPTIERGSERIAVVPCMRWDEQDLMVVGDRVIVRGEISGTPAAPFLGAEPTGRGFSVMTIDIHKVRDGKIARTHHIENWAGAIRQMSEPS